MQLRCFKAYDVRGLVPEELDESLSFAIGRSYAREIAPSTVVVGHDARLESPSIAGALIAGLTSAGAEVIDIGLCGPEEVYFHAFHREPAGVGGGIMVTASHNPKGYCGMKFVQRGARPLDSETLATIHARVATELGSAAAQPTAGASVRTEANKDAYVGHLLGYVDLTVLRPLRILCNPGHGPAGLVLREMASALPLELILINDEPDGTFPWRPQPSAAVTSRRDW